MNFQLDENVQFGDWNSPMELKDKVKTIIVDTPYSKTMIELMMQHST